MGKLWSGKKLAKLANRKPFTIFAHQLLFILESDLAVHTAHLPIVYPPIDSD